MTATLLRKVVFLDTNVLHFVGLYLSRAKERGLFPFGGDEAAAQKYLSSMTEADLVKSLGKGLRVVMSLRRDDPRVEYSTASELELLAGRAKGKAIEKAAAEGVPDRMWTRLGDKDIGKRLLTSDLTEIAGGVDGLGGMFQDAGIDATVSNTDRGRDVLAIAREVMGLVYLSVIDSVIYAEAIAAQADEIISADDYLRKTVHRIKTDTSAEGTRARLQEQVAGSVVERPRERNPPGRRKIARYPSKGGKETLDPCLRARHPRPSGACGYSVTESPSWRRWVTPRAARDKPIHRWHLFAHSFTERLGARPSRRVETRRAGRPARPLRRRRYDAARGQGKGSSGVRLRPFAASRTDIEREDRDPV